MHSVSVVILVLSHAGRWLAGTDGIVSVRWTVPDQTPQATLVWELLLGSTRLSEGSTPLNSGDRATDLKIRCPSVRARVELELRYRLVDSNGKRELAAGREVVHAFPDNLTAGWTQLLKDKNITVVDSPTGLPALLTKAGVACNRLDDVSGLQLDRPDIVLIAANRLDDSPFSQGFIFDQARAGAGVIIFQQSNVNRLAGCAVLLRARPQTLDWSLHHPLFAGLSEGDLNSWIDDLPANVPAVRCQSDGSALTIAGWPMELPDPTGCENTDSLFAVQCAGRGRIVLCQLTLGSWETDPRSQLLLGNALDDLSTPAEPVSRMGRSTKISAVQARVPTVPTPAGDER